MAGRGSSEPPEPATVLAVVWLLVSVSLPCGTMNWSVVYDCGISVSYSLAYLISLTDAVFGAELKQLCDKEKVKVPIFVTRSIEAIEKRGIY